MTRPLVLDGALGTELEKLDLNIHHPLWATYILITQPSIIKDVHISYLNAGSDIILTSSYQASLKGLIENGADLGILNEIDALDVLRKSVEVAKQAIDEYALNQSLQLVQKPIIGGSIGPYGAYLCNGAEYTGEYGDITSEMLKEFHRKNIQFFMDNNDVDLISIETNPNFKEFKVIIGLLNELYINKPHITKQFYISLNFKDQYSLCDGTPINDLIQYVLDHSKQFEKLYAIGANCIDIQNSTQILTTLNKGLYDKGYRFVIYPNSGEVYDGEKREFIVNDKVHDWSVMCLQWCELGAVVIGGCCRTGPKEILEIRRAVDSL